MANSLSVRDKGTFPSQAEANPKDQISKGQFEILDIKGKGHEQVNSVTMLRSGRQIDNRVKAPKKPKDIGKDGQVEEEKQETKRKSPVMDNT